MNDKRYWLAFNHISCAMCEVPTTAEDIECSPTPHQLLGFKSRDEAKEWLRFLVTAPFHQIRARAKIGFDRDRVTIITPAITGPTSEIIMWSGQKKRETTYLRMASEYSMADSAVQKRIRRLAKKQGYIVRRRGRLWHLADHRNRPLSSEEGIDNEQAFVLLKWCASHRTMLDIASASSGRGA